MTSYWRHAALLALTIIAISSPTTSAAESCNSLHDLSFLLGEWQDAQGNLWVNEKWERVSDDTFEGQGWVTSVNSKDIVAQESLRIVLMSDKVFYFAKVPSNPLPVAFALVQCSDKVFQFHNPNHDFPQTITYSQTSAHRVDVEVTNESGKRLLFQFRKTDE